MALASIEPSVRGMHDLLESSVSMNLRERIVDAAEQAARRESLLSSAARALEALVADGYPAPIPTNILSENDFLELQREIYAISAAFAEFSMIVPQAGFIGIQLNAPQPKD